MAKEKKAVKVEGESKDKPKYSRNKIACIKCGQVKAVRPEVYQARVEKYGSEEKLQRSYLCMKCRPKKEKVVSKGEE